MSLWSSRKTSTCSAVNFEKICDLDELWTWACNMAMWYWSADTLYWQVPIDHSMDIQYQRSSQQTKAVCLCQLIIWSMAAMLGNFVVVVVMHTRPQAIPLAMIIMRKSTHGFPSLSYTCLSMGLRLAAASGLKFTNYSMPIHWIFFCNWANRNLTTRLHASSQFQIPGYRLFRKDRCTKKFGSGMLFW